MRKYSFLTEDVTHAIIGGGTGAATGGLLILFNEWCMKYVKECAEAISTSNTPQEAFRKVTDISKTDAILSRKLIIANMLEQRLRNLSFDENDPDWKDKMFKAVRGFIRGSRVVPIILSVILTLQGIVVGSTVGNGIF